jgi:hypothetical protein
LGGVGRGGGESSRPHAAPRRETGARPTRQSRATSTSHAARGREEGRGAAWCARGGVPVNAPKTSGPPIPLSLLSVRPSRAAGGARRLSHERAGWLHPHSLDGAGTDGAPRVKGRPQRREEMEDLGERSQSPQQSDIECPAGRGRGGRGLLSPARAASPAPSSPACSLMCVLLQQCPSPLPAKGPLTPPFPALPLPRPTCTPLLSGRGRGRRPSSGARSG